ncbi:MAG: ATP-binding protein [bacterium]
MSTSDVTYIGRLTDVAGGSLIATLKSDGEGFEPVIKIGNEQFSVGQLGTQVLVKHHNTGVLAQVTRMWEEKDEGSLKSTEMNVASVKRANRVRHIKLLPLGEIDADGKFNRGVNQFPTTGSEVHLVTTSQLEVLFDKFRKDGFNLGYLSSKPDIEVFLDPNSMFTRHMAILGQSGAGKSWTTTSIIQRAIKCMPKAHIILLDLHGEYGWKDDDGNMHSAFPEDIVRHVDAQELEIPYWLLTYAELIDFMIDKTDPNATLQTAFLRDVLYSLRKKGNADLNLEQLSVDSPVYFSLKEMYLHFKKANEQQLDFGKTKGSMFGAFDEFLVRFQSMYNDKRYDFLLRPKKRTHSETLEDLLRDFVGLGEEKKQITVIDLSPVPSDVRPMVSSQIARLAYEFNYWNPRRREFPILLICEEAHQYLPRSGDPSLAATRKAMERIAKEGRKYGVGLCVVSQRPTELSETVLAQCNNYLCLRISNPDDQEYVRGLMPEGEADLADILASLRRGEALAVGDATPLPTRFQVHIPEPPPASSDVPLSESWRTGPDDLDVKDIIWHWWQQKR